MIRLKRAFVIGCCLITPGFVIGQKTTDLDQTFVKEVDKIAKNRGIKRAFEFIDVMEPLTIKDHIHLTEIPAPPFKEELRAAAFLDRTHDIQICKIVQT